MSYDDILKRNGLTKKDSGDLAIETPIDGSVISHVDFNSILGTGNILQGIGESEVKFGLNFKPALSFEFGAFKSNVSGIELGFMFEGFTEEIVLVPNDSNDQFFTSFFVTLFYGRRR